MICQENMVCVHSSMYFLSWPHSSGSQSSIICDRQSIVYLSRTLPLTCLYLSSLYNWRDKIYLFSPPFQALLSFTAQHPGVTSWNDGLCEAGREITLCSPLTDGCTKGHQNWHLIQPECQGPASGNSPLRVRTGVPGRCPEKGDQLGAKTSPHPGSENRSKFLPQKTIFA